MKLCECVEPSILKLPIFCLSPSSLFVQLSPQFPPGKQEKRKTKNKKKAACPRSSDALLPPLSVGPLKYSCWHTYTTLRKLTQAQTLPEPSCFFSLCQFCLYQMKIRKYNLAQSESGVGGSIGGHASLTHTKTRTHEFILQCVTANVDTPVDFCSAWFGIFLCCFGLSCVPFEDVLQ